MMLRLRICASIVSMLSLATVVLVLVVGAGPALPIALLAAAACLAIVAPFDAPDPPQRTRVLIACLAYVSAVAVALALGHVANVPMTLMIAIVMLGELGIGLTCWAFATRKRRRMPRSRRYYDN